MIGRIFKLLTGLSLFFWGGLFLYLMIVQPVTPAPAGWPAGYNECVAQWGNPGNMTALQERCGEYYALLGDRNAPFISRAKAQVVGRLSGKVIDAYLSEVRLQPGQVVGSSDIMAQLGSSRIAGMLVDVVREADTAPPARLERQQRCMLDKVRLARSRPNTEALQQQCAVAS